jgi:hypothetical protein
MRPAGRCGPRHPDFPYYAGPTEHIAFWNEGPKIPTNQPEARELQADGFPANQEAELFLMSGDTIPS